MLTAVLSLTRSEEKTMKVKLIAFDVNGTLFDDTQIFWEAINGIFPKYGKKRLPLKTLQEKFRQPWTSIYREFGITETMASDDGLYKIYNQLYGSQGSPTPVPGLKETLDWLRSRGVSLAIVSTQQNAITVPLLEKHGLAQKFSEISGSASDKAVALQNIMAAFDLLPECVAYVGDQEDDMKHAKRTGCVSIAFCGGLHDQARLKKTNQDFTIESMSELKNLLIF